MAIAATCPHCRRRMNVPEAYAGRRVTCPRCLNAVRIPDADAPEEAPGGGAPAAPAEAAGDGLTPAARLGVAALMLGAVSILLLCLPVVGYASAALSGLCLAVGAWGLVRSRQETKRPAGRPSAAAGAVTLVDGRPVNLPLAGAGLCLLVLALALLPFLFR